MLIEIGLLMMLITGAGMCTSDAALAGLCTTNTGSQVVLEGTQTTGGGPAPAPAPEPERVRPGHYTPPAHVEPWSKPWEVEKMDRCIKFRDWDRDCFRRSIRETAPEESTDDAPAIPVATVTDVAEFTPAGVSVTAEPQNVAVVGLPANLIAAAAVQTVSGSLFGLPVSVRFSPAAYDYVFGDGEVATVAAPGKSWADLGQAQFTPTPTSHIYKTRGTFPARVDVRYTAEVDFGTGWYTVDGEVTSPGAPQPIRVLEASTALVAHTCTQRPAAPGC